MSEGTKIWAVKDVGADICTQLAGVTSDQMLSVL